MSIAIRRRLRLKIEVVKHMDHMLEGRKVRPRNAVITGKSTDRHVADRHSPAERPVKSVVSKIVEGQKEEPVPSAGLVVQVLAFGRGLKPIFLGIFAGEFFQPPAVSCLPLTRQTRAKGG
ncbi:UNVERIFIED_ORG: hypothetical protein LHK14_18035 [Roseateles sp. XES5]|nr:hypothetical protein [Roseateles sp. XES5]